VDSIQRAVANHFNIAFSDMRMNKRHKNIVLPRQIAMYLTRQLTNLSLPEIGHAFGGKDHTTVLYSCKKMETSMTQNKGIKSDIEKLIEEIQQ